MLKQCCIPGEENSLLMAYLYVYYLSITSYCFLNFFKIFTFMNKTNFFFLMSHLVFIRFYIKMKIEIEFFITISESACMFAF